MTARGTVSTTVSATMPAHNNNACTFCHYDVADDRGTTITNPAAHINGVVDVRVRETDPDCAACHAAY